MASYAKADIHGLPKDNTQHEAKKMCDKRSRSFQLSWKENISLVAIHTVELVLTPTVVLRD